MQLTVQREVKIKEAVLIESMNGRAIFSISRQFATQNTQDIAPGQISVSKCYENFVGVIVIRPYMLMLVILSPPQARDITPTPFYSLKDVTSIFADLV